MRDYTDYSLIDILDRDSRISIGKDALPNIQGLMTWLNYEHKKVGKTSWIGRSDWLPERWWCLIDFMLNGYLNAKWYDDKEDWKEFSVLYPNCIFLINGQGEESEDIWEMAICDGQMSKEWAVIEVPSLDIDGIAKRRKQ